MPLSDEQIDSAWQNTDTGDVSMDGRALARWVESAATAPLLAQIAELKATVERGKSVVRHDLIALGERAKLIMELEAQLLGARKDAERFHEAMQCFKDMQLPHGLCKPRSRMACTNCNAADRLRELVDSYRGPKVVSAIAQEQPNARANARP